MASIVGHFLEPLGIGTIYPRVHNIDLGIAEAVTKRTMTNVIGIRFRAIIGFHKGSGLMEVVKSDRHTGQNSRHGD